MNFVFLLLLSALAAFIGPIFDTPLGLELIFERFLGPMGIILGFGIGRIAEDKVKQLSLTGIAWCVILSILFAAGSIVLYLNLLYTINTPSAWILFLEAVAFTLPFLPLGIAIKLAGLSLAEKN